MIVQPLREVPEGVGDLNLTAIVQLPSVYLETYKNRVEALLLTGIGVGARLPLAKTSIEMELDKGIPSFLQAQPQSGCTVGRISAPTYPPC